MWANVDIVPLCLVDIEPISAWYARKLHSSNTVALVEVALEANGQVVDEVLKEILAHE